MYIIAEALEELIDNVVHGNIVAVKLFAEAGVNLNMKDGDGWTPLHHAVANGQVEIEELLVEKGAASENIKDIKYGHSQHGQEMTPITQENE